MIGQEKSDVNPKQLEMFRVDCSDPMRIRPHFADPQDEKRLASQNSIIFDRLSRGPATNVELADLARCRNFTARTSEIRDWLKTRGYSLVCVRGEGGLNSYSIEKGKDAEDAERSL